MAHDKRPDLSSLHRSAVYNGNAISKPPNPLRPLSHFPKSSVASYVIMELTFGRKILYFKIENKLYFSAVFWVKLPTEKHTFLPAILKNLFYESLEFPQIKFGRKNYILKSKINYIFLRYSELSFLQRNTRFSLRFGKICFTNRLNFHRLNLEEKIIF